MRLILHRAGASCGGIGVWALGKAENAHLSLSRTCTHLSRKAPEEKCPSSFHVIEAKVAQTSGQIWQRMEQFRQEEAEVEG